MKLTVERTELLRALAIAERGVNAKSPLPMYAALMLEATDDGLRLTGTDGEVTLSAVCPAATDQIGKTAVLAANFGAIIRGLAGVAVAMILEKNQLTLSAQGSRYKLAVVTGEAWPPLPVVAPDWTSGVNGGDLALGLSRVLPAVRADTDRPALCGVFFEAGADGLTLVATDTLRLHLARVRRGRPLPEAQFILGGAAARQLLRVLQDEEGVTLTGDGATLKAEGAWGTFLACLIGEPYLNYKRFLGAASAHVTFERPALADAVRRAAYVAQGCADRLLLAGDAAGQATLTARSEYGEAEETLALTAAAPFEGVAISARYLGQALAGFTGETVQIVWGSTHRGLRLEEPEKDDYFAVVMPMMPPQDE